MNFFYTNKILFFGILRNSGARIACGVIGIRRPIDRLPVPKPSQTNANALRQMSFIPAFRPSSKTMQMK